MYMYSLNRSTILLSVLTCSSILDEKRKQSIFLRSLKLVNYKIRWTLCKVGIASFPPGVLLNKKNN